MRDLLYHFTTGEYLRQILETDKIKGETRHEFHHGKEYGVSLTRDCHLNLLKTYAISSQKPFRLALDREKLAHRYRIIPVRDEYLRGVHKAKRHESKVLSAINYCPVLADTNEAEELLLDDIKPLLKYLVEIAVDSNGIIDDTDTHNGPQNYQTYWDIMAGTFNHDHDDYPSDDPIVLPESVRFVEIDNQRPHPKTDFVMNRVARKRAA